MRDDVRGSLKEGYKLHASNDRIRSSVGLNEL